MALRSSLFAWHLVGSLLALAAIAPGVAAQDNWPGKPVRVVIPFAPGGSADTLGRVVARHLSEHFNQAFVVENRVGAGGVVGWQSVLHAPPDGYTLVVAGTSLSLTVPLSAGQDYDPKKDVAAIALIGGPPTVLVINSSSPVKSLAQFIDSVQKMPEGLSWGSPGPGSHGSLIGDVFRRQTKLNMVHIGYRGAGPAVVDVAANHLPAAFVTLGTAVPQMTAGKLRGLAVTASQRVPEFPDIPTFKELGFPELTGAPWFALSGPPGTPPDIIEILNREVRRALKSPEVKSELAKQNLETFDFDAAEFQRFVQAEAKYWGPYTKDVMAGAAKK